MKNIYLALVSLSFVATAINPVAAQEVSDEQDPFINGRPEESSDPIPDYMDYSTGRFDVVIEQIAEDIYVARRKNVTRVPVQANTLIIVNEEDVVLVDIGYPTFAENLLHALKDITDKPISALINTHWHQDHNLGSYKLKEANPDMQFIADPMTLANLELNNNAMWQAPALLADSPALVEQYITVRQQFIDGEADESVVLRATDLVSGVEAYMQSFMLAKNAPHFPDTLVDGEMTLWRGNREIQIKKLGNANTDGDLFVWLPNERILAAGDAIVGPTPYGFGSFPMSWVEVLDDVKAMKPAIIVPGHGEVMTDLDYVNQLQDLFRTVAEGTAAALADGITDVDAVRERIDFAKHEEMFTNGSPVYEQTFNNWFKVPIVSAAIAEQQGTDAE